MTLYSEGNLQTFVMILYEIFRRNYLYVSIQATESHGGSAELPMHTIVLLKLFIFKTIEYFYLSHYKTGCKLRKNRLDKQIGGRDL